MLNFEYYCPTRIVFGKDTIARLPELIDKSKKVLMIYGGGSIKKNGVYDQVKRALSGYDLLEFSGIEPNPKYETCMKAVELIKRKSRFSAGRRGRIRSGRNKVYCRRGEIRRRRSV